MITSGHQVNEFCKISISVGPCILISQFQEIAISFNLVTFSIFICKTNTNSVFSNKIVITNAKITQKTEQMLMTIKVYLKFFNCKQRRPNFLQFLYQSTSLQKPISGSWLLTIWNGRRLLQRCPGQIENGHRAIIYWGALTKNKND